MRRLQEREERRQKKAESGGDKASRKASAMASKGAPNAERKSWLSRLRNYLHEVRQELKKVTWPTRDQMVAFTTVTVITSVVLTFVIFGLDIVMKEAVFWLLDLI
jgi:preprotein translocase subunit SecE